MRDALEPGSCLCDPRGHRQVSTKPLLGAAGFPAGGKARSVDEALPSPPAVRAEHQAGHVGSRHDLLRFIVPSAPVASPGANPPSLVNPGGSCWTGLPRPRPLSPARRPEGNPQGASRSTVSPKRASSSQTRTVQSFKQSGSFTSSPLSSSPLDAAAAGRIDLPTLQVSLRILRCFGGTASFRDTPTSGGLAPRLVIRYRRSPSAALG